MVRQDKKANDEVEQNNVFYGTLEHFLGTTTF